MIADSIEDFDAVPEGKVGIEDIYERESEYMRDLVHIYLENFNDVHSIVEKIKEL